MAEIDICHLKVACFLVCIVLAASSLYGVEAQAAKLAQRSTSQLLLVCVMPMYREHMFPAAAPYLQGIASCQSLVARITRALLLYLDIIPQHSQQQQQPADISQQRQQHQAVQQLLQQLFLLAPASFVALDCLPQLSRVLLGPAAADNLLHGSSMPLSSSSSSSLGHTGSWQQQQVEGRVEDVVGGCLGRVLSTARHMAAAVNPR